MGTAGLYVYHLPPSNAEVKFECNGTSAHPSVPSYHAQGQLHIYSLLLNFWPVNDFFQFFPVLSQTRHTELYDVVITHTHKVLLSLFLLCNTSKESWKIKFSEYFTQLHVYILKNKNWRKLECDICCGPRCEVGFGFGSYALLTLTALA
jgi:hypothetical protein